MLRFREVCRCGLTRNFHNKQALDKEVTEWDSTSNTIAVPPWNFGNLDVVGHYSYLDLPDGTVSSRALVTSTFLMAR